MIFPGRKSFEVFTDFGSLRSHYSCFASIRQGGAFEGLGFFQIRFGELGAGKIGLAEIRTGKPGSFKLGPAQVGADQVAHAEIDPA